MVFMAIFGLVQFVVVLLIDYIRAFVRLLVPPARKNVQGQVCLITGAGHGIGRETALEMSKAGANLVLWDLNTENNEETARLVTQAGGKAFAQTVDVSDPAKIADAATIIRQDIGEVSILINNAGVINVGELLVLSEKDIRRTFNVNTLGPFWTVKEFLPSMIKRKVGHICNMSSTAAFVSTALFTDYDASKAASYMFTETLRCEMRKLKHDFIHVSGVYPIYVETGFLRTGDFRGSQSLTPMEVALQLVDGLLRNKESIFVPPRFCVFLFVKSLIPTTTYNFLLSKIKPDVRPQYKKEN